MQSNYTETEVKLYVPDLHTIEMRLQALGATLAAARVYEHNVRFENAERTLSANSIALRLRKDTRVRLTYKDPPEEQNENKVSKRFEAEVEISDFDAMVIILGRLGYSPDMVYEKYRTTYRLDGAEIVLDEMPYGNFVEIEADEAAIHRMVKVLNLENAPRMGASYHQLFKWVRQNMQLTFDDLTFENFKGVDVPESAFAQPHPLTS